MSVRNFLMIRVLAMFAVAIANVTGDDLDAPARRTFTFEVVPVLEETTAKPQSSTHVAASVHTTSSPPESAAAKPAGVAQASGMAAPIFAPSASIVSAASEGSALAASVSTEAPPPTGTTAAPQGGFMQAAMPLLAGAEHIAGEADKQFEKQATNLVRLAAGAQDSTTSASPTMSAGDINFSLEHAKDKLAQAEKEKQKIESMLSDAQSKMKHGSSEGEAHGAAQHASRDAKHGSQKPTSTDASRKPQDKKTTEKAKTEAKEDAKSTSRVSSETTTEPSRHEESKTHAHEDMTEAKKLYSIQPAMREQFATGFQGSGLWLSCAAIVFLALLLGVVRVIALNAREPDRTANQTAGQMATIYDLDEESALE